MTTDLVFVWNQLNSFERLLRVNLVVMDQIIRIFCGLSKRSFGLMLNVVFYGIFMDLHWYNFPNLRNAIVFLTQNSIVWISWPLDNSFRFVCLHKPRVEVFRD